MIDLFYSMTAELSSTDSAGLLTEMHTHRTETGGADPNVPQCD